MIQQELDEFEKLVLTDIFGGYTQGYLKVMGFDVTNYVRKGINVFETYAKRFMDLDGNICLPSLGIKAKPTDIYLTIKGVKKNDTRRNEDNTSSLPQWFNDNA